MGRLRGVLVVLASMLVLGALAAAGASASGPHWVYCGKAVPKNTGAYTDKACSVESPGHEGKYELLDGIGKGKGFKGKAESDPFLRGMIPPGEIWVRCDKASIAGRYVAPNKVARVHLTMSKCRYNISTTSTCAFSTTAMSGELGWINQAKGEAGIKLTSEAEPETGLIGEVQNSCLPEVKQRVHGTMIGAWSPVGLLTKEPTLAFSTAGYVEEEGRKWQTNRPAFEGEEGVHVLRNEFNGPETGGEWVPPGGSPGGLDGRFPLKGEALMAQ
jgi:hypothetical protein